MVLRARGVGLVRTAALVIPTCTPHIHQARVRGLEGKGLDGQGCADIMGSQRSTHPPCASASAETTHSFGLTRVHQLGSANEMNGTKSCGHEISNDR